MTTETMNTKVSDAQKYRVAVDWSRIAGPSEISEITCTTIGAPVYAYGTELGCLRLEHKMKTGRAAYSENLSTWYYCNAT